MRPSSARLAPFLLFVLVGCSGEGLTPGVGPESPPAEGVPGAASSAGVDASVDASIAPASLDGGTPTASDGGTAFVVDGAASDAGASFEASVDAGDVPLSLRVSAASATAASATECVAVRPFYWEVGDGVSARASGSEGGNAYTQTTTMNIASASKWFYSSYWVEKTGGSLSAADVKFMNFWSGYTNFSSCAGSTTVAGCLAIGQNGVFDPATENKFDYGGGHMQKHAADNGLGALTNATLADEIRSQIGTDIALSYSTPQLAGGAVTSAGEYAKLLRKIVTGALKMKSALGTHAVCTNPATCPAAIHAPTPKGESWHYAVGHWVEDDPAVGDGAFSSPGAFGFYPWIDASKRFYGVLARVDAAGAISSVKCGRLIRKAWLTGQTQ